MAGYVAVGLSPGPPRLLLVALGAHGRGPGEDGVQGLPRTPGGLLHRVAWARDTVWLGGSMEDAGAIAGALPVAEDAVALGSHVSKLHVLHT